MVNPVSSGVQSFPTSQPSFTTGAEARANTQQVQPRQAPAAESQRGDQRLQSREDDNRRAEARTAAANESRRREESRDDTRSRGENLDVVV